MENYAIFKVSKLNMVQNVPGEWKKIKWTIYDDGLILKRLIFNPDSANSSSKHLEQGSRGKLNQESLDFLKNYIEHDFEQSDAAEIGSDNIRWHMTKYAVDGSSVHSIKGGIGNDNFLLKVVSILP